MADATDGREPRPGLFARWLSPDGYLGLHLVVGFVVAAAAGYLFDLVKDAVFSAPATLAADAWAERVVADARAPWLTAVMTAVTLVGNSSTLTALTVAVGVALYLNGSHRRLATLAATMIGGSLLNLLLKTHFQRPRPSELPRLVYAGGYSFPSGHSMGSMLFFGALAYVVYFSIEGRRALRVAAVVACALLVVLVGGSRVYLGVHYLSDVAAGFAGGLFWLAVCVSGTEAWVRLRDWRRARAA